MTSVSFGLVNSLSPELIYLIPLLNSNYVIRQFSANFENCLQRLLYSVIIPSCSRYWQLSCVSRGDLWSFSAPVAHLRSQLGKPNDLSVTRPIKSAHARFFGTRPSTSQWVLVRSSQVTIFVKHSQVLLDFGYAHSAPGHQLEPNYRSTISSN